MHPARISFLLPAFKTRYLKEAITSILSQTYPFFKVIVSDDASPEPIKEIVDSFNDPRIIYRRNRRNIGAKQLVQHWNNLISECDSDFIVIASDDDIYHPLFLEEELYLAKKLPHLNLYMCQSNLLLNHSINTKSIQSFHKNSLSQQELVLYLIDPNSVLCIGNVLFRTSALKKNGGFINFPYAWKSDSATLIALSKHGIGFSDKVLFTFRMSDLNISSHSGIDRIKDYEKINATLCFHQWLKQNLDFKTLASTDVFIKNRLEGEIRSYYWVLSFREFFNICHILLRENWFRTSRNKLSFIWGWLKSR